MVKRRTILETDDPQAVLEAGFSTDGGEPDLLVSTYLIDADCQIRTRAEHCAGSGLDRPERCVHIDLADLHDSPIATPANEWFRYADTAHRELRFADHNELLAFITRLLSVRDGRITEVTNAEGKAYVKERYSSADDEWLNFFEKHAKGPRWKAKIAGMQDP